MALNAKESKVLKAISSMLQHDLLGLDIHDQKETSHHSQFRWEELANAFRLKCAKSPFCDSISAAFRKTHDYKYIDNPTFKLALETDMKSMGLPNNVREEALRYVDELIKELDENSPSEMDAGWPAMDDMYDVTTMAHQRNPKYEEPFTGGGPNPKGKRKLQMEGRHKRSKKEARRHKRKNVRRYSNELCSACGEPSSGKRASGEPMCDKCYKDLIRHEKEYR